MYGYKHMEVLAGYDDSAVQTVFMREISDEVERRAINIVQDPMGFFVYIEPDQICIDQSTNIASFVCDQVKQAMA